MISSDGKTYFRDSFPLGQPDPTASVIESLVNSRYTVNQFREKELPGDSVEQLLKCAKRAPSKLNRFPYRIYVIDNQKGSSALHAREKLLKHTSCTIDLAGDQKTLYQGAVKTAQLSFLYTIKPVEEEWEAGEMYLPSAFLRSTRDAMLSVVFMLLRGLELGLDTACTGCFEYALRNKEEFWTDFGLDQDETPCIVLNFGYAEAPTQELSDTDIPRYRVENDNIIYSPNLAYLDPEDPSKGTYLPFNRGPQRKIHPENFIRFL